MKKFLLSFLFHRRMKLKGLFKKKRHQIQLTKLSRVAAAQIDFRVFKNVKDFYNQVLNIAKKAKEGGAEFVCFPQGMDLELRPLPMKDMNVAQRERIFEVYSSVFKDVAWQEGIYIAESKIKQGKIESTVWTPSGRKLNGNVIEIGGKKMHFSEFDSDFGEEVEDDVHLYVFPRFGYAPKKSGEISKAWLASQQNYVFSIESRLVGRYFNTKLNGKTGIYAPLEMTKFQDGVLAISNTMDKEEVIVADLDFESLERLISFNEYEAYDRLLL